MKIEICLDSVESAAAAQRGGAHRVELCDNLMEGGTTPSIGAVKTARRELTIGLQVIIRPRGGDFLYSGLEFDVMRDDIDAVKDAGADGVVIGLLTEDGDIDVDRTETLIARARPLNVTFHRAFDMCQDPFKALEQLIELGVDRILTSGQESSVLEGLDLIAELHRRAGDRAIIMPGGGVTLRNVDRIVRASSVREIHLSANKTVGSAMAFRNSRVYMGGTLRPPEYDRPITDADTVRRVASAAAAAVPE